MKLDDKDAEQLNAVSEKGGFLTYNLGNGVELVLMTKEVFKALTTKENRMIDSFMK